MAENKLTEQEQELLNLIEKNIKAAMGDATVKETKAIRDEFNAKMAELRQELNYEAMQKQLDAIFVKLETRKPASEVDRSKKAKTLTDKWIKAFIKRDKNAMGKIEAELKIDSAGNWEPGDGGLPLLENGPVVMHDAHGFDVEQGAYLVPELLLAEVARWSQEFGLARRDMRYLPFNGPGKERVIPFLLQNVVVAWVDQGGIKPKSKPFIGKVTQTLEKISVIVPMTEEVVEDTAIDLIQWVGRLIAEAFAEEEDRIFFAGDTLAGDPFDGVLNAAGTTIVDLAGTFELQQLNPMGFPVAFPTPAIAGGKFYMHRQTLSLLQGARAAAVAAGDAEGAFLFQAPTGAGQPFTLWGYPIEITDVLPAYSEAQADEMFAFFSNLSKTCYYGEKGGLRTKLLTEASLTDATGNKINLAEQDMIALRAYKRVGYVPVLPDGIAVFQK